MKKKKIAAVLICAAALSLTLPGCGAGKKTESKAQEKYIDGSNDYYSRKP